MQSTAVSHPQFSYTEHSKLNKAFAGIDKKNLYSTLKGFVTSARKSYAVAHNSLPELLEFCSIGHVASQLNGAEFKALGNYYNWQAKDASTKQSILNHVTRPQKIVNSLAGAIDFNDFITSGSLIALTARMGTGKTQLVGVPMADVARKMGYTPIFIAHRVSLLGEISIRTGTINYEQIKSGNIDFKQAQKQGFSLCINSLSHESIQAAIPDDGRYILFMDEASQTVRTLKSKNIKATKQIELLSAIKKLLNSAQSIIIADADLNDFTLNFVEQNTNKTAQVIHAKRKTSHIKININLEHKAKSRLDSLFVSVLETLKRGEKTVFYSNEKDVCTALGRFLSEQLPDCKTLILTSATAKNKRELAFARNAETLSKHYELVAFSPTITSGVSIENSDFETAFCYYSCSSISHIDAIQQMVRFRLVNTFYVVLSTKSQGLSTLELNADHYKNELEDDTNQGESHNFFSQITAQEIESKNNFTQYFIIRLKDLGYSVSVFDGDNEQGTDVIETIKELKAEAQEAIVNAENIMVSEALRLKLEMKIVGLIDEHYAVRLERFDIQQLLQISDLKESHLKALSNGYGYSSIVRGAIAFSFIDSKTYGYYENISDIPLHRKRYPTQTQAHANELLRLIFGKPITGEHWTTNTLKIEQPTFSNSTLSGFGRYVEQNALPLVLTGLISPRRIKQNWRAKGDNKLIVVPLDEKGLSRTAKYFINQVGLKTKQYGRTQAGGKDENTHGVDLEQLEIANELFTGQQLKSEKITAGLARFAHKENEQETINNQDEILHALELEKEYAEAEAIADQNNYKWRCVSCLKPTEFFICSCCGFHEVEPRKEVDLSGGRLLAFHKRQKQIEKQVV